MLSARLRFAALWLSQACRTAADWTIRLFAILVLVKHDPDALAFAWHLLTAIFIAPFLILSPVNGAISNGLPKRWVLVAAAAWCLAVLGLFTWLDGPWPAAAGLLAIGTAVYSPARYALLPAAAQDSHLPLTRVNGLIEMGGATAIVLGVLVAQLPGALGIALACSACCLVAALPAVFRSDVCRPEPIGRSLADFFRDGRRILGNRLARGTMLGLACFLAMVTAGSGVLVSEAIGQRLEGLEAQTTLRLLVVSVPVPALVMELLLVMLGVACGSLTAGIQGNVRRGLGLVPLGTLGMLAALAWAALAADKTWPCFFLGFASGLVTVPLRAVYQDAVPADARGNAMAVQYVANYVITAALALLLVGARLSLAAQLWVLAALAGIAVVVAARVLLRELVEQVLEIILWPVYRVSATGPGLEQFPREGPVIVLANHASYCDPLWVGKVMPRRLHPMMTSVFFDKPVLYWLMTRVAQAIRVPTGKFRREAPELREAVALLNGGDCLLIFPEGMLRRKDEQLVRQFGQGIWRILQDRPETPVVVCWIEGGWGSMTSYRNGLPFQNKRPDWWRHIRIGVDAPRVIDRALLADGLATRAHLMRACLEARRHLGLEVPSGTEAEPEMSEETAG